MKRLTEYTIPETGFSVVSEEKYKRILMEEKPSVEKVYNRLKKIEDILGDEYDLDRLRELAQADREGRIVLRSAGAGKKCGSCGHFRRIPGTKRGTCAIRRWERNRMGQTEPWRHSFTPSQSYGACREYVRGESSATE